MTSISNWITHRMNVLDIAGPAALAEHADVAAEMLAEMIQSNGLGALQQSQRRRLAWALQVNLKSLNALADGEIEWIDDADRYLAFSSEPASNWNREAASGNTGRSPDSRDSSVACGEPSGSVRAGTATAVVGLPAPPQGTAALGRVGWDGRIEFDDCWDEQWGRRLADGQPQRRDTYALETPRAGQFVIVRNANPWEAAAGAWVAVYLCDDSDGAGYFGHLTRCVPGAWGLQPGLPGHADDGAVITIEPERALRIGRLVREWSLTNDADHR